jgi:23S rRNA (uracil1939-C5)-methyltransferase
MPDSLSQQRAERVRRVEHLLSLPVANLIESPQTERYRARIELTPGPDGTLGYMRHRTHDAIAVTHCAVARPEINELLPQVGPVPRFIQRVGFRSNGSTVVIHARCKDRHRNKALGWLKTLEPLDVPLALNGRGVFLNPLTQLTVAGIQHKLSPSTFYQVNLEVNERLVADVLLAVQEIGPSAVLDLFSGAGNFSMPLAQNGLPVTMIEANPTATKDARRTAAAHEIEADIRTEGAEKYRAGDAFFDVAILDPPRRGAGAVLDQVLTTRPRAVVLISCNPKTLAADLKRANGHGYAMNSIQLYEMFPHTDHGESMGILLRNST